MTCEDCRGKGGWWLDREGQRVPAPLIGVRWQVCGGCGGQGISSCCEGACGRADDVTNQGANP